MGRCADWRGVGAHPLVCSPGGPIEILGLRMVEPAQEELLLGLDIAGVRKAADDRVGTGPRHGPE